MWNKWNINTLLYSCTTAKIHPRYLSLYRDRLNKNIYNLQHITYKQSLRNDNRKSAKRNKRLTTLELFFPCGGSLGPWAESECCPKCTLTPPRPLVMLWKFYQLNSGQNNLLTRLQPLSPPERSDFDCVHQMDRILAGICGGAEMGDGSPRLQKSLPAFHQQLGDRAAIRGPGCSQSHLLLYWYHPTSALQGLPTCQEPDRNLHSKYESKPWEPGTAFGTSWGPKSDTALKGLGVSWDVEQEQGEGQDIFRNVQTLSGPVVAGEWMSQPQNNVTSSLSNSLISLLHLQRRCQEEVLLPMGTIKWLRAEDLLQKALWISD